jgi:TonB family protein
MTHVHGATPRGTLLRIPLVEERHGTSLLASFLIHALALVMAVYGARLLPQTRPLSGGSGGGPGGDSYTVGVADDLGGGAGMEKPSLLPQPPAMPPEMQVKQEPAKAAVQLPDTLEAKKPPKKAPAKPAAKEPVLPAGSNVIPTEPRPGAGGSGGTGQGAGGSGGVSIGLGMGGWGDSWYARAVESRIGSNWIRPVDVGARIEIVYSFSVAADGSIYNIRKVKSCGNEALDLTAERAIRASNPLAQPPPEMRVRPLEFVAQFVYPPGP